MGVGTKPWESVDGLLTTIIIVINKLFTFLHISACKKIYSRLLVNVGNYFGSEVGVNLGVVNVSPTFPIIDGRINTESNAIKSKLVMCSCVCMKCVTLPV